MLRPDADIERRRVRIQSVEYAVLRDRRSSVRRGSEPAHVDPGQLGEQEVDHRGVGHDVGRRGGDIIRWRAAAIRIDGDDVEVIGRGRIQAEDGRARIRRVDL